MALNRISDICKEESREVLLKTITMNPYSLSIIREIQLGINDLAGELP